MKVAHLTSVHNAQDVRIFRKQCQSLAASGYRVSLIAPDADPTSSDDLVLKRVDVPTNRLLRVVFGAWSIYKSALKESADVYHFHDPELMTVGLLLKMHGKKVVYDVHENYPAAILTKYYLPRPVRRLVASGANIAEKIMAHFGDAIVAATPAIAQRFPPEKSFTVQNYPLLSELEPDNPVSFSDRPPNVAYVGIITKSRSILEIIEALDLANQNIPVRLQLAGSFRSGDIEASARRLRGWEHIDYFGWQSRKDVARLLGQCRAGLVLFQPAPNHVEAQPNKLFEYMSAGLPIIASDFPLWRRIVEEAGCGLLVNPEDPHSIAKAITWILEHPIEAEEMGRRGRTAVEKQYNWEVESAKLLELYRRLETQ